MRKTRKIPPASTVGPSVKPVVKAAPATKPLPVVGEAQIHCRRVDALYTVAQHKDCPYCFGAEADVATGEHQKFCDFKPGEDPISFGFPDDQGRYGWK